MRTIVHISDLHFGKEDMEAGEALIKKIDEISPALVINSGDLTQRARGGQFEDAAKFMKRIKFPQLIVPGNHDIPLFDIFRRFLSPLGRYKKFITDDLYPVFEDDEIAVAGINTARSFTWKNGRISYEQMSYLKKLLCGTDDKKFKIVVTHHPFVPPPGEEGGVVGRGRKTLEAIDDCGVDLVLAGHAHISYTADLKAFYPQSSRSIIIAQAGTAISVRHRGEPNTFNLIKVKPGFMDLEVMKYEGNEFVHSTDEHYTETDGQWARVK